MARKILFLILFSGFALASPLYTSIRGAEDFLTQHCIWAQCQDRIFTTKAREFDNGNTFVKLGQSVTGKKIRVAIPNKLDANQFFELLILVRTLKSEFATSIDLISSERKVNVVDAEGIFSLEGGLIYDFLRVAGMDSINGQKFNSKVRSKMPFMVTSESVVVGNESNSLAEELSTELKLPLRRDSEIMNLSSRSMRALQVESFNENYNQEFLKALMRTRKLKDKKMRVTFISPYLPYARSDKKDQPGVAISGRLMADLIEAAGADSIVFVRAHAPQSEGFFSIPTLQITGRKTINNFLKNAGVEVVVSPDAGFQKDATLYADELGVPISVVNKQRNLETGESQLKGISGESVAGKKAVIIDDETASGSTLAKAAELLKSLGAKTVICVVTHLAGKADKALSSPFIDQVVVTNSLPVNVKTEKLVVLSLGQEITEQIREIIRPSDQKTMTCRAKVSGF